MNEKQIQDLEYIKGILIPTLQFIPRGIKNYTDHGINHTKRIEEILQKIIRFCNISENEECKINDTEEYLLFLTALIHDIGCIVKRENHASVSASIIKEYLSEYEIFEDVESFLIEIVKAHSGDPNETLYRLPNEPILVQKEHVKLRYISAVFRLADACDIKVERCPRLVYRILEPDMSSESKSFWKGHRDVVNLDFNIEKKKIIVLIKDKDTTKIIIDYLQRNIKDVKDVLKKYHFPFLELEVQIANWTE